MESRIRQLQRMLVSAVIVDGATAPDGVIAAGVVVELRYDGDTDTERFLVGSIEEQREGVAVVSPASPLGQALLGRRAGDVVEYEAPNGRLSVHVVGVGE